MFWVLINFFFHGFILPLSQIKNTNKRCLDFGAPRPG